MIFKNHKTKELHLNPRTPINRITRIRGNKDTHTWRWKKNRFSVLVSEKSRESNYFKILRGFTTETTMRNTNRILISIYFISLATSSFTVQIIVIFTITSYTESTHHCHPKDPDVVFIGKKTNGRSGTRRPNQGKCISLCIKQHVWFCENSQLPYFTVLTGLLTPYSGDWK